MPITDGDFTLMNWDPVTGRTVWSMFDGQKTVIRTDYPVEATIAENSAICAEAGKAWTGDWHRIASIPQNVFYDENAGLSKAHDQGDDAYVSRWLNDSDNRAWRTRDGRV